jgi:uncharacterized membrane protein
MLMRGEPGSLVGASVVAPEGPVTNHPPKVSDRWGHIPGLRQETLRTTLWFVPSVLVLAAAALFGLTYGLDRAADAGAFTVPSWVNTGGADAARTILTAIAAAVITVVGVVFSITILALQLASTQFGPRMLRNFIRDVGTQLTLGTFVATFVFSVLVLGSVANQAGHAFVPHISVTVALGLLFVDLGVLIYFIHHIAKSIQLNEVVHGIARDLQEAIDGVRVDALASTTEEDAGLGLSVSDLVARLDTDGVDVPAISSGYLQAIGHDRIVELAEASEAVVRLVHRPGHFLIQGRPLAVVWPPDAAAAVSAGLERAHVTGPHRTVRQDLQFAIDQLVEIAIRALSPAVNDTFTALTCIDWLGDGLSKLSTWPLPEGIYRDSVGRVRLIDVALSYDRIVNRAFDKIRQAGRGMPAVGIRQLETLGKIAEYTIDDNQRAALARQADMVLRTVIADVVEPNDQDDLRRAHRSAVDALHRDNDSLPPRTHLHVGAGG